MWKFERMRNARGCKNWSECSKSGCSDKYILNNKKSNSFKEYTYHHLREELLPV